MWDSIECEEAQLKARRVNPLFPYRHEKLQCMVFPWKYQESAVAIILKELYPKVAIIDSNSALDAGNRVVGKIIEVLATRQIPRPQVQAHSSRHRAQFSIAAGFVYCKVIARYFDIRQ